MKKRAFLFLFLFGHLFLGCQEEYDCPTPDPYFRVQGIQLFNVAVDVNERGAFTEGDTLSIYRYQGTARFDLAYYARLQTQENAPGSLYALSCLPPGGEGAQEGIASLEVLSLRRLVFYDQMNDSVVFNAQDTISDALVFGSGEKRHHGRAFMDHSAFLKERVDNFKEKALAFRIKEALHDPFQGVQKAQFKLYLKLTNGDVFEDTTQEIYLKHRW